MFFWLLPLQVPLNDLEKKKDRNIQSKKGATNIADSPEKCFFNKVFMSSEDGLKLHFE